MSPVFRHGRLRLYLLKLLDESPRHGYEVIRLLQDRFLGVYAPSPGTIYPRLARLEEEGLVTHDEADGRKVYRITDKGREELHARLDDIAELEESITASVRDIAREVNEDVRATVRSLREELSWAVSGRQPAGARPPAGAEPDAARAPSGSASAKSGSTGTRPTPAEPSAGEAAAAPAQDQETAANGAGEAGPREAGTGAGSQQREGAEHAGRGAEEGADWRDCSSWANRTGWGNWGWGNWQHGHGPGPHGWADPRAFRDLERVARQFARELREAALHAQTVSEDAVHELRVILEETIDRIKADVFTGKDTQRPGGTGSAKE